MLCSGDEMARKPVLREKALVELMAELFSAPALRRWLRLEFGSDLVNELPDPATRLDSLSFEAVVVLAQHGRIDASLFDALLDKRPHQAKRIREVARLWSPHSSRPQAPHVAGRGARSGYADENPAELSVQAVSTTTEPSHPAEHGSLTLAELLARGVPFTEPVVLRFGRNLAEAIAAAHEGGRRGGCLDPARITIGVLEPAPTPQLPPPGGPPPSLAYVPPEFFTGAPLTAAADLYTAGQIMWEAIMACPAFTGDEEAIRNGKSALELGLDLLQSQLPVSLELEQLVYFCTHPDVQSRPTLKAFLRQIRSAEYRVASPAVLAPVNLSFDGAVIAGDPYGWFNSLAYVLGVSPRYAIRVEQRRDGPGTCVHIGRTGSNASEFGSLMQRIPAKHLCGLNVRYEGLLRSSSLTKWAGLWLRADNKQGRTLFFDNMADRPITGTTSWARYAIETTIPEGTEWLNYGVLLSGDGTVWADDMGLGVRVGDSAWIPLSLDPSAQSIGV